MGTNASTHRARLFTNAGRNVGDRIAGTVAFPVPSITSLLDRKRAQYSWFDHLVRALFRYVNHTGDRFAAAITYYTVLSLIHLFMLVFAVAGFVLAGDGRLLNQVEHSVLSLVPGVSGRRVTDTIATLINARAAVGVFGLLAAIYSGLGWMTNLRDALTAQWVGPMPPRAWPWPWLRVKLKDLRALTGLVLALLVSLGLTVVGLDLGPQLLALMGLKKTTVGVILFGTSSILLGLLASWLVFLALLTRGPRIHVAASRVMRGAVFGAIGFELLKLAGNLYVHLIKDSAAASVFGSVLGVLFFVNIVSRFLVFVTAWTATGS